MSRMSATHEQRPARFRDAADNSTPDYPGVGPEHAYWHDTRRVTYTNRTDQQALDAFVLLTRTEGIIPALETSHAVAHALKLARTLPEDQTIVINLSGRGDKDSNEAIRLLGIESKR